MAEHIDVFTYHPYGGMPKHFYYERMQFTRDVIAKSSRNIVLWMGENGSKIYKK